MAWTDDDLRAAFFEVAESDGGRFYINYSPEYDLGDPSPDEIRRLRHLLTALGIDHQPKPELPDTPGALICDVVDDEGDTYKVMALDRDGWWRGVDQNGCPTGILPRSITSWRPLDLDKVRGEQGE